MSDHQLLNQQQITELFTEIDDQLQQTTELDLVELAVVGGAALVLRWGLRATYDVDFVTDNLPNDVRSIATRLANEQGLQADWLNDGATGFTPNLTFEPTIVYAGMVLRVIVPDSRYLLAMKLFSSRETDLHDATFLASQAGIDTAQELLDLVTAAYQPRPIDVRVQYFTQEVAGRVQQHQRQQPGPDLGL